MNLKVSNLSIFYGKRQIIKDLNFVFESGKINLIVGKSGCGKSSLLLSLSGFHKELRGDILLDEKPFKTEGNFALAFQNPESMFFNSTVFDEIAFALKNIIDNSDSLYVSVKDWMVKWGLDPDKFMYKNPLELSGGEKRRVALAACTVFKPPLILLDEPLAGLDLLGQASLCKLIKDLSTKHCIIVVTHEPEVLLTRETNILFINEGEGKKYSGLDFYLKAMLDESFYPLPKWFQDNPRFEEKKGYSPLN